MIYFIITTCLYRDLDIRMIQYTNGIKALISIVNKKVNNDYKIIIVENNGLRDTFLNEIHDCILYTKNNYLNTSNKGNKELMDIRDVIKEYNIQDNDMIVKITGRYIVQDNSDFFNYLDKDYDGIIMYGSYLKPDSENVNDCVTGLIGMKCKYVKNIQFACYQNPIEWNWAKASHEIEVNKIKKIKKLGLKLCPGSNYYFVL